MVKARSGEVCEICRRQRHNDFSHRVAASQGGLYRPANGVSACRGCHTWLHASPARARAGGWHLTSDADPIAVPVWLDTLAGHGWCLLDDSGLAIPLGSAFSLGLGIPELPPTAGIPRPRTPLEARTT